MDVSRAASKPWFRRTSGIPVERIIIPDEGILVIQGILSFAF